jgi:hypothetical protein
VTGTAACAGLAKKALTVIAAAPANSRGTSFVLISEA